MNKTQEFVRRRGEASRLMRDGRLVTVIVSRIHLSLFRPTFPGPVWAFASPLARGVLEQAGDGDSGVCTPDGTVLLACLCKIIHGATKTGESIVLIFLFEPSESPSV